MSEKSRKTLGKTKQIKDATLGVAVKDYVDATIKNVEEAGKRFDVEDLGEKNAPPLEMTDELKEELLEGEKEKVKRQKEIRSKTVHYLNGVNEWKLIAKTGNEILDWEHITQAMPVGNAGCIVMVKESIGQKMHSTMTFVPGVFLSEENNKWILR